MASLNVLQLTPNIPQLVTLKYSTGMPCKNGRLMYSLVDGRTLFLPPYIDERLKTAGIRAGQQFSMTMVAREGEATDYELKPLSQPEPPPVILNGIQPSGIPSAIPAPGSLRTDHSQRILSQLIASIEVVKAAENFSTLIGRPVTFSPEDIRALAISCFISQSREAQR